MVECTGGVVQPEKKRPDEVAPALPPEAADDAIGGPDSLDLDDRALARAVSAVGALGDDTVERAPTRREPRRGGDGVSRRGRQV